MNRRRLFLALSILLSIPIVLLGTEFLIRVTHIFFPTAGRLVLYIPNYHHASEEFLYDDSLGWSNIPNSEFVTFGRPGFTNSHGFRSPEYPVKKPAGRKRILVLGDSFAWGYNVANEDIFSRVAERQLRAANIEVDIINAGVSGWGTDQEYLFLLHEGLRYHPDVVVLALFAGNDPLNNANSRQYKLEKPYFVLKNGDLELRNSPVPLSHPVFGKIELSSIARRSEFMQLVIFALWRNDNALMLLDRAGLISLSGKTKKKSNEFDVALTVSLITQMRSLCLKNGANFVVMKFGSDRIARCGDELRGEDCAQLHPQIEKEFGKLAPELDYIDLDTEVTARGFTPEQMLSGGSWSHWGETGHRVVGEVLADFLVPKLEP